MVSNYPSRISTAQAAKLLGVSKERVIQYKRAGRLSAELIGNSFMFNSTEVAKFKPKKNGRPKRLA